MMKYKTVDSNLGNQCAVHHREMHRMRLEDLFHSVLGGPRYGPARVKGVMGGRGVAHMAVQ